MPRNLPKQWFQSVNPATGKSLRKFKAASKLEVDKAVEKARKAFDKWRALVPARRAVYLDRAAKTLRSQKEKLSRIITLEMGKTLRESTSEVLKCAWTLEYYAENGEKFLNPEPSKTDATDSYVSFDPIGVVASIMPWNFPCGRLFASQLRP